MRVTSLGPLLSASKRALCGGLGGLLLLASARAHVRHRPAATPSADTAAANQDGNAKEAQPNHHRRNWIIVATVAAAATVATVVLVRRKKIETGCVLPIPSPCH